MRDIVELDITVTNAVSTPSGLPTSAQYVQIFNPHATASLAFTINGQVPSINGVGITLAPLGSETFDAPSSSQFPLGNIKLVSSVSSQNATILWR